MRAHPLITTLAAIGAALIVIDGDTIRSDEERIRLEGIDAAEIGHAKSRPSVAWRSSPSTGWSSCSAPAMSISGGIRIRSRRTAMAARSHGCWSTARTWPAS